MIGLFTSLLAAPVAEEDAPAAATVVEAFGFWATVADIVAFACLVVGSAFSLLAVVGLLRMPDVYARMQAATKAGTLGVAFIILGVAAHFASVGVLAEGLLIVTFLFLTTPVASHLIARAAYFVRVPIWSNTWRDDLHGAYDEVTHDLDSEGSIDVAELAEKAKAEKNGAA